MRLRESWSGLQQAPGMEGWLVRWGLVCMLALVLWATLLEPWSEEIQHQRDTLSTGMQKLERLTSLLGNVGGWQAADLRLNKKTLLASGALLQQKTPVAARSALQANLLGLAEMHHLKLENQHFLPIRDESGIGKRVAVQLSIVGSALDGYRFLESLANQDIALVLEKLTLSRRDNDHVLVFVQVAGFMPFQASDQ